MKTNTMENISSNLILILIFYFVILFTKWTYEDSVTNKYLLNDILQYDTELVQKSKSLIEDGKYKNAAMLYKLFIKTTDLNLGVWFGNWNIFDWGEAKYIKEDVREEIIIWLNYWRQTGKFPYHYKKLKIYSV